MLTPAQLGVVINTFSTDSIAIGEYYVTKRNIPAANVLRLSFPDVWQMERAAFDALKHALDTALAKRPDIKALAVCAKTSRVKMGLTEAAGINGFTSALSMGVQSGPTLSPYYDSSGLPPFRISMLLWAHTVADAKAMIDRGVASDHTRPAAKGYVMWTGDSKRNIRAWKYVSSHWPMQFGPVQVEIPHQNALFNTTDTMFYFEGVDLIEQFLDYTNYYPDGTIKSQMQYGNVMLPGAWTDDLDSLYGRTQKGRCIFDALKPNGATASYGTVVEPYAIFYKFANPEVLMSHYVSGDTIIEAAWKSVQMPYEGIFIGEPLAAPYS